MHELSITRSVVGIVSERAQGQKVLRVTLEVGRSEERRVGKEC